MKINRNNYEAYFLDYIEGRLNKKDSEEIEAFLINNPDLEEELFGIEDYQLPICNAKYEDKEKLYLNENNITNSNFNDYCVAYIEDDLTREEKNIFLREIKGDKKKGKEFNLFLQTKLKYTEIIYPNKKSLYRYSVLPSKITKYASIAALITLFLGFSLFFQQPLDKEMGAKIVVKPINTQKGILRNTYKSQLAKVKVKKKKIQTKSAQLKSEGDLDDALIVTDIPKLENQTIANIQSKQMHKISNISPLVNKEAINDLSDLRALAAKKIADSPLVDLPKAKNKAWLVTKFIIRGIAKITNRDIEIKDKISDEGKIEYLAISTPDFRYERNMGDKLFNKP